MFILLLVKPKRHKADAPPAPPPGSAPGAQVLPRSNQQTLDSLDRRWTTADDAADPLRGLNQERNGWRRRRRRNWDKVKEDGG